MLGKGILVNRRGTTIGIGVPTTNKVTLIFKKW